MLSSNRPSLLSKILAASTLTSTSCIGRKRLTTKVRERVLFVLVHSDIIKNLGRARNPDESPTIIETWKEMEKLLASGRPIATYSSIPRDGRVINPSAGQIKTIGVSNFGIPLLEKLLAECSVLPATNQVEMHPFLPHVELKTFCDAKNIILTAYSPLGQYHIEPLTMIISRSGGYIPGRPAPNKKGFLDTETVLVIADRLRASPGQVALAWAVQRGTIVVPKSETVQRIKENIALIKLSPEDMVAIDSLHSQPSQHRSLLTYHKDDGTVFGWTYEQMGWRMKKGGVAID
jgi:glycerol 2-dehydrogenase (NADP+)